MDISKFRFKQRNNTNFPEVQSLNKLLDINDIVGAKYFYPCIDGGDEYYPVLYINGSILEGNIHLNLIHEYNRNKEKYKNQWLVDVSNIDINSKTIFSHNIPCARLILDDTHKIAELLFVVNCNIDQVSQVIKNKFACKVYFFSPNASILSRTAHRLGKKV